MIDHDTRGELWERRGRYGGIGSDNPIRAILSFYFGLLLLVAFAAAISWLYGVAAPKASVAWSTWWVQLITVTLTVTAAAALFQVREYWPKAYAALEALVGLTAAWIALSKNSPIEVGIALAAAVYLMVRAQDNLRRQAKDRTSSKGTPSAAPIEDLGVRS